jgi:hypothetical protein
LPVELGKERHIGDGGGGGIGQQQGGKLEVNALVDGSSYSLFIGDSGSGLTASSVPDASSDEDGMDISGAGLSIDDHSTI